MQTPMDRRVAKATHVSVFFTLFFNEMRRRVEKREREREDESRGTPIQKQQWKIAFYYTFD